jgi:hypothetical protein
MEPYQQNYLQILSGDAEAYEEEVMRCSKHFFETYFCSFNTLCRGAIVRRV